MPHKGILIAVKKSVNLQLVKEPSSIKEIIITIKINNIEVRHNNN